MPKKSSSSGGGIKSIAMPKSSSRLSKATAPSTSSANSQPSHIPSTFTDNLALPKIFVFDLDYTLWPFWVDTHVTSPLKPASKDASQNTAMVDRYGESFQFYRDVPGILHAARAQGIALGLASRTTTPDLAEKMLRGIVVPVPPSRIQNNNDDDDDDDDDVHDNGRVDGDGNGNDEISVDVAEKEGHNEKPSKAWDYFTYKEIYPGSKIKHFNRVQRSTAKRGGEEVAFADMIFFDDEGRNREVETQLGVTFVLVRDGVTVAEIDRGVREWRRRRGVGVAVDVKVDEEGEDASD